jgi:hypothetical protein
VSATPGSDVARCPIPAAVFPGGVIRAPPDDGTSARWHEVDSAQGLNCALVEVFKTGGQVFGTDEPGSGARNSCSRPARRFRKTQSRRRSPHRSLAKAHARTLYGRMYELTEREPDPPKPMELHVALRWIAAVGFGVGMVVGIPMLYSAFVAAQPVCPAQKLANLRAASTLSQDVPASPYATTAPEAAGDPPCPSGGGNNGKGGHPGLPHSNSAGGDRSLKGGLAPAGGGGSAASTVIGMGMYRPGILPSQIAAGSPNQLQQLFAATLQIDTSGVKPGSPSAPVQSGTILQSAAGAAVSVLSQLQTPPASGTVYGGQVMAIPTGLAAAAPKRTGIDYIDQIMTSAALGQQQRLAGSGGGNGMSGAASLNSGTNLGTNAASNTTSLQTNLTQTLSNPQTQQPGQTGQSKH